MKVKGFGHLRGGTLFAVILFSYIFNTSGSLYDTTAGENSNFNYKAEKKYSYGKAYNPSEKVGSSLRVQPDEGFQSLYNDVVEHSKATNGTVGVGIIHLESGKELYYNPSEKFPMASCVKIPVAVELMSLVDKGALHLDDRVALQESDLCPGSGRIKYRFAPGAKLSLDYLLENMLTISDNTATDIIFRVVGGPSKVDGCMEELGLKGISVDRPIFIVLGNCWGVTDLDEDEPAPSEAINAKMNRLTKSERIKARKDFINDTRDTATPEDMAQLLKKLWKREILSENSSEHLLDVMGRVKGDHRIKGLLPPGTKVYHKTGTITGGLSDIGIIELPGNAGHVVVVVFVKGLESSTSRSDRAMALIARDAYDYFQQN